MLDMTIASKAVETATTNAAMAGILAGLAIATLIVILVAEYKKNKRIHNEYMKTLTDSEYRKYNEMLKKQEE